MDKLALLVVLAGWGIGVSLGWRWMGILLDRMERKKAERKRLKEQAAQAAPDTVHTEAPKRLPPP